MDQVTESPKLDRPARYEIKVPGRLEEYWSEWLEGMTIEVESGDQVETVRLLFTALGVPLGLWLAQYILQRVLGP